MKKLLGVIAVFLLLMFVSVCNAEEIELPSEIGRVININYVDNFEVSQSPNVMKQIVKVKILTGQFKGIEKDIENMITGNPMYDINLKKGDKVILHLESSYSEIKTADDVTFYIADIKRDNVIVALCVLFAILLIAIGRKKGVLSLVSIGGTVLLIFGVLVPMVLSGFCPIATAVLVGILSTILTIYLVGGYNAKSFSAIMGTVLSLILSGGLALLTIEFASLTGFSGEESMFLYTSNPALNFQGLLAASIIIAALGALMDTSVSIASTINEIYETDNSLSVKQLFTSGMNVGKDIIGTMSNTLILVYLGSSLPLILLSSNIDLLKFFNLNQVATEISSALIGSIAILACVPFTAMVAAFKVKRQGQQRIVFKED